MTIYHYTLPEAIQSEAIIDVKNEQDETVLHFKRFYSNPLKKLLDYNFDFRYFVEYHVLDLQNQCVFKTKKVARKGRIHFEANDLVQDRQYMIAYDGGMVMIPELSITDDRLKMTLHKEMESWSHFNIDDQVVARWRAKYIESHFFVELELLEDTVEQSLAFYVGIAQATLFIGA